jgi:hypothetical protein
VSHTADNRGGPSLDKSVSLREPISAWNQADIPNGCTVGAAELAPPASGRIALFSIAMEFDVFSAALPVVAAAEVVQLVSGFWLDDVVDCAAAAPATTNPAKIVVAKR